LSIRFYFKLQIDEIETNSDNFSEINSN